MGIWQVVTRTRDLWRARLGGEEGASAVEYAIMASLIAAVIVGAVAILGGKVNDLLMTARDAFP